ncbi:hypothetical protein QDY71_06225 [Kingella negevensis]|uniref:hypothetical protein n=1 Tax=Kingella negevensis TaxID=1522312 RepID=UPI00254D3749|nr:hypothetical protein [Kingella negevensis]MDK4697350.1 hypothetical protein [Kingella negevensis]
MSYKTTALLLAAALGLSACNQNAAEQKPAASAPVVAASKTSTQAVSASPVVAASVTVTSKDGKVSLSLEDTFTDKISDVAFAPEKATAEQVTLLQYDEARNLTISAVDSGSLKGKADKFFTTLKSKIESNKEIKNAKIENVTATSMSYSYERSDKANESCTVTVTADNKIITVCATSTTVSAADLQALLLSNLKVN